jgi:predicted nicotinamide N-methyase
VCEKEKGMSDNPCHPDASFTDVSGCIASSPPPTSPPYLISWRGARVLELGAGVGISGLVAAALGARTLLTDLDEALPLLQLNALINAPLCAHAPRVAVLPWGDVGAAQAAAEAVWGSEECGCAVLRAEAGAATEGMAEGVAEGAAERAAEFAARVVPERAAAADPATAAGSGRAAASTGANTGARGPKIVLCSDLVYDPDQYSPLVATLVTLQRVCLRGSSIGGKGGGRCAGGGGSEQGGGCVSFGDGDGILLLMGHVSRHPDEHLFFREVQQHFAVRVIHGPPLECLNQVPLPVSVTEEGGLRRVAREAEGRGEAAGGPDRPGVGEASVRQRGGSQGQRAADGPESASSIAETAVRVLEMVPHV